MANAVTSSVSVCDTFRPHILVRQDIKLVASSSFGETCFSERYVSFEHKRKVMLHGRRNGFFVSNPHSSCNIGCAVEILSSGIKQQHAVAFYLCAIFGCRMVVNYRAVSFPTCNRAETLVREVLAHRAEFVQFIGKGNLCLRRFHSFFLKPHKEAR